MLIAALTATALSPAAHALERANLSTGSWFDCARHEAVDNDHVRLFLVNKDGEPAGFIELAANKITGFETIPDPPKPLAPTPAAVAAGVAAPSEFKDLIAVAGAQRDIDVDLLASIIHNESGFHANAVSRAGARGLMQLMPATARTLGVKDSFNPAQNIDGGAQYLATLLKRYYDPRGDTLGLQLAIAAYNAGPGAVDRYHGIPPYAETRAYVARVLNEFINRKKTLKKPAAEEARRAAIKQAPNQRAANEIPSSESARTGEASR